MTLTLTPQEFETVYLALNNYSLEYIRKSASWGKSYKKDLYHEKAEEIGRLQVKIWDQIIDNKINSL